ncbi:MAG: elongation factor Ts [Candidatus Omnitrophica bacterium]|nr:elongation factor Ts [Candidatus Omnitrophota bacterium]MBU0878226.1 elongation factor Ts [Candidatus Omnitrophota bacterium]MBU1133440.1 elongation factor Ts [Candidatus Omnitrophota bacterium]MBU1366710.1 elongation factor Ts [Candidatus Omnitrophota bacterium]MBU1523435.1 elongation factor Ts [Candidatus Omnitrophota bacterium]
MSLMEVKRLRETTSLGINDCKKALEEAEGDFDKALQSLKKKGIQVAKKKGGRVASQGLIEAYVHFAGNLGAIVEVNCETDFVARTDIFKKFVKDIAMQVVAANPKYIKKQDIPQGELANLENVDVFVKESCLLEQTFIKNSSITIEEYLQDVIAQCGENILIKRFTHFSLGEG